MQLNGCTGFSASTLNTIIIIIIIIITLAASCCTVSTTLFRILHLRGFVHNFSRGPSSNSNSSVRYCHSDCSPSLSCNFRGFMLHCQHKSFPDPSRNFRGFVQDFSSGLSCQVVVTPGFVLHCQHGSSLSLLDNTLSFCQLSSDCLPHSTTPQILQVFTLVLSLRVHTF